MLLEYQVGCYTKFIKLSYITFIRHILYYRNKSTGKPESANICKYYCSLQEANRFLVGEKIDELNSCWTLGKSFKIDPEDSPDHNWLISTIQIYTLVRLL